MYVWCIFGAWCNLKMLDNVEQKIAKDLLNMVKAGIEE